MSKDVRATPQTAATASDSASRRPMVVAAGIALCTAAAACAMVINRVVPAVNPMLISIVAGAVVGNLVTLPRWVKPGVDFSAKRLLRIGVALLGVQLMFSDVAGLGWAMIVIVIVIVVLGIAGTMFAGKLLGLSWTQSVLIACGFSICGAAAAAAANEVVDAKEEELLTAVALVVIFGTMMILAVPLFADLVGLSERQAGMWAGGSIHEVAQAVAAGGVVGGGALAMATVVKLARVLMLAPVMAYFGARRRRMSKGGNVDVKQPPLVPVFILGFLGCVALRSSGLLPDALVDGAKVIQTGLLTAAMFALGIGVRVRMLRSVGPRPFVLAGVSTVWVASIALGGVLLAG